MRFPHLYLDQRHRHHERVDHQDRPHRVQELVQRLTIYVLEADSHDMHLMHMCTVNGCRTENGKPQDSRTASICDHFAQVSLTIFGFFYRTG